MSTLNSSYISKEYENTVCVSARQNVSVKLQRDCRVQAAFIQNTEQAMMFIVLIEASCW